MTFRWAWTIAVALTLAVGCQQPRAVRQMERELRFQEDRIYQLEDWIRQYNEQLECCRNENNALRTGKPAGKSTTKAPVRVSPFGDGEPKLPDVPEVEIPKVEIPKFDTPPAELPVPKSSANDRRVRKSASAANPQLRRAPPTARTTAARPRAETGQPGAAQAAAEQPVAQAQYVEGDDSNVATAVYEATEDSQAQVRLSSYEAAHPQQAMVARITLNRLLTAPVNRDGQPGDDGLMVVVEPRNEAGELIAPTGNLSVSAIDPAATSEQEARVGRWNYDALQTARLYRRTTLGDGIQLNLAWQERKPAHEKLELYVRLTTADGRKLQVHRTLTVKLPASNSQHEATHPELQPEPLAADQSGSLPAPAAAVENVGVEKTATPPAALRHDMFQVVPVAESLKSEVPANVAPQALPHVGPQPAPIGPPAVAAAKRPEAPKPAAVATAAIPSAPVATVAPVPRVPRRPRVVAPPADEQVAIPREPGSEPESPPDSQSAVEPIAAKPRPQWAPFRK